MRAPTTSTSTRGLSRRRFLGTTAGLTAGVATGGLASLAGSAVAATGGRLIPDGKVGTILYTQRDVRPRLSIAASNAMGVSPTMGYLGGPDFPADPNDLGPLVPIPGGWYELLDFLANVGFKQVEFAGYSQNPDNVGGSAGYGSSPEARAAYLAYARTLRGFLDEFGLEAIGNHGFIPGTWPGPSSPGGGMSEGDYVRYQTELEFASILGMPFMGTGGDPASSRNRNVENWDVGGEKWEALNDLSLESGIQLYPHNHSDAYNFLQDGPMVTVTEDRLTGDPIEPTVVRGESGKRLMQHYLDITDPDRVVVEMDIFWATVAQHQWRWRYDWDGNRVEDIFDPLDQVARQTKRYALYHAKDGDRTDEEPGVGRGYEMVPFGDERSDIDYATFFEKQGARGFHNPNYEQDNAPGGDDDPGQSLRFSHISADNMMRLRD